MGIENEYSPYLRVHVQDIHDSTDKLLEAEQ